jgi:hypothetical protein
MIATGVAVGVLSGIAVYLWRASANMPQLNNDGLSGYSANDWLAPVIVFVVLSIYADLIPPTNPRRFRQVRAASTVVAFAVNVITIWSGTTAALRQRQNWRSAVRSDHRDRATCAP